MKAGESVEVEFLCEGAVIGGTSVIYGGDCSIGHINDCMAKAMEYGPAGEYSWRYEEAE